jgi:hypothetical protein
MCWLFHCLMVYWGQRLCASQQEVFVCVCVCVCLCGCVCGRGAHVLACYLPGNNIQVTTKNFRSVGNCPEFRTEFLQTRSRIVLRSTAS